MKIASYTPSVTSTNTTSAKVKAVSNALAYGEGGSGLKSVSNAVGQWAAVIQQKQEDDDKQTILSAMDEYNKGRFQIMYNQDSGLMNTTLDNSANISNSYVEQEKKLRSDVMGRIKLHNDKNKVALNNLMNNSAMQGWQNVYQHENKQRIALGEVKYNDYLDNQLAYAQANYADVNGVGNLMGQSDLITSLHYGRIGGDTLSNKMQNEARGKIAASAIDAAIAHEDYETARMLKDTYGAYLTNKQRNAYESVMYRKEEANYEYNLGNQLFNMFGDNEHAVRNYLSNSNSFNKNTSEFESLVNAIGGQESGGDYNAKNSRTGAYGKYQIMEDSWKEWAPQYGIDPEDKSPENQEKVARLKLKEYYDKYGARGAAIAWYGGEGALNYGNEAMNMKQGNGDEPSINEYADSVLGRMGNSKGRRMNHEEQDRVIQQWQIAKNIAKRERTYLDNKLFENAKNQLFGMLEEKVPAADAWKWVQSASNESEFEIRKSAYSKIYGGRGNGGNTSGEGKSIGSSKIDVLLDMLAEKPELQSKAAFLDFAKSQGANNADLDKLDRGYGDFIKGQGRFAYDLKGMAKSLVGNTLKGEAKTRIERGMNSYAKAFIRKYRAEHNGMNPDESLVREAMAESLIKKSYGTYITDYGTFWDSTSPLDLSDAELASAGIANIQKISDDMYHITYLDGRIDGNVNGEYLARVTGAAQ